MSRSDAIFRGIIGRIGRDSLLAAKALYHHVTKLLRGNRPADVVFVAGVQRSGTNMLMDVLEQSFCTDVYHERDDRAFDNYQMRAPEVIGLLRASSKAERFVIKSLCELQDMSRLMEEFAPARTVWILRDYNDVVNSMRASFGSQARQVQNISKDRDNHGWLANEMTDATYALVRQLAHPDISNKSAAALIWYFRNQLFFDQGFDRDDRVLLVRYESLVTNPAGEFRRIFDFMGIPYRPWHSRMVVASSIGKKDAPAIDLPIREVCDELTQRFDALAAITGGR